VKSEEEIAQNVPRDVRAERRSGSQVATSGVEKAARRHVANERRPAEFILS